MRCDRLSDVSISANIARRIGDREGIVGTFYTELIGILKINTISRLCHTVQVKGYLIQDRYYIKRILYRIFNLNYFVNSV